MCVGVDTRDVVVIDCETVWTVTTSVQLPGQSLRDLVIGKDGTFSLRWLSDYGL